MMENLKQVPGTVWMVGTLIIGAAVIALLVSSRNQQVLNNVSLPIELVEYFDYQCSHCQDLQPTIVAIESQFGDKVQIVPKYLPIFYNSSSNYAFAYGAEAARQQEKFDIYVSTLLEEVEKVRAGELAATALNPSYIAGLAGLDVNKFAADYNSDTVQDAVNTKKVEVALEFDEIFRLDSGSRSYLFGYGAEAAREQGKFMEYHNAAFAALTTERLEGTSADVFEIARDLGLDMVKFNDDYVDPDLRNRVLADRDEGLSKGLSSTPSVFIEGQRTENIGRTVNGKTDYTLLVETIDRYVKQGEANAGK